MTDFLQGILDHKKHQIQQKSDFYHMLKKKVAREKFTQYGLFKNSISKTGAINLIAEIKKASPSQGLLRENFDVMSIADIYVKNGAVAISIVTEEKYFLGKRNYITRVSENYTVPLLTKDFIIDEGQIYESFLSGTSAVLLIVALLSDEDLKHLIGVASQLDLDCLIEVHDESELDRALIAGAEIIGVNNRDLHTFEVSLKTSERLIPKIPKDKVIVAESGIKSHQDVLTLQTLGAHAVLIGETFMRCEDIAAKMKEVMGGG